MNFNEKKYDRNYQSESFYKKFHSFDILEDCFLRENAFLYLN
jgi:hypothetical protein